MHVHVSSPNGEAKFWLEPIVALAQNENINPRVLKDLQKQVEKNYEAIKEAWKTHFRN